MNKKTNYHEQLKIEHTLKLREQLAQLPIYIKQFFRGKETSTSNRTRIGYAYDLNIFFHFLKETKPELHQVEIKDIPLSFLESLTIFDIEDYQDYLKIYHSATTGIQQTNGERGIARKLSALRSLFSYLYKRGMITNDPTTLLEMPKIHDKVIVQLEQEEVASLLQYMENCADDLSVRQRISYEKTKYRDIALITLMLGTGIRVSECVGLDIEDVDFQNCGIHITRKGGNEMIVYFSEEVKHALEQYMQQREKIIAQEGHESALFLSMRKKRICVDAVSDLVKKYTSKITKNKTITPHKLRSTYGTLLYQNTGDIYLVADVLGHKNVNTTKKHYAAIKDSRRKAAATAFSLRQSDEQLPE